jgi:tetratricopeptide (TPR) repeat protein
MTARVALLGVFLAALGGPAAPARAQGEVERQRAAKELFFDKKFDEARRAWQAILPGKGPEAESAAYWMARCSENLGELERAFREYGDYLARPPADRALAEEARTSRVGIVVRLYKAGNKQHLPVLSAALNDPSKAVRYYAALQSCRLDANAAALPAVPILKRIVAEEKDDDLVERAKVCLLRLEPQALSSTPPSVANRKAASWIRVRIYDKGKATPQVSVNLPMALADLVFKSLPEETRRELRLKGYDADNFWDRLKKLGPTEIIDIRGDEGEKVQIWIE